MNSTAIIINGLAVAALIWALVGDREKARAGLRKGLQVMMGIAPVTLLVVAVVGIVLAFIPAETVGLVLGEGAGFTGILAALGLGALVHMPALLGFPLAGKVLQNGGSPGPVAAFITSLTMIGVFTIPMEIKILGRRFTLARNLVSAALALSIAVLMGVLV